MLNWIGEVAQALAFAALWRQVLLLAGAGVVGAAYWACLRNPRLKPSTRMVALLGALLVFCVLSAFVFLKGF